MKLLSRIECAFKTPVIAPVQPSWLFVSGFHASRVLIMLCLSCHELWALQTPESALPHCRAPIICWYWCLLLTLLRKYALVCQVDYPQLTFVSSLWLSVTMHGEEGMHMLSFGILSKLPSLPFCPKFSTGKEWVCNYISHTNMQQNIFCIYSLPATAATVPWVSEAFHV